MEAQISIPIYRALKLGTKNEYVEGYLTPCLEGTEKLFITRKVKNLIFTFEIDPSTLSIHFPDMIDSEGTKIFASLSKDGKGGDICKQFEYKKILTINDLVGTSEYLRGLNIVPLKLLKVTGIQEYRNK